MTEQPGYVLEEAVKLFDTLRRRMNAGGSTAGGPGGRADDVWGQAVQEEPEHLAGGAPECRYCPICRTVAAAREGGPDVVGHVVEAGQSLVAAMREAVAAYERSRPPGPSRPPRSPGTADPAGPAGPSGSGGDAGSADPS